MWNSPDGIVGTGQAQRLRNTWTVFCVQAAGRGGGALPGSEHNTVRAGLRDAESRRAGPAHAGRGASLEQPF